MLQVFADQRHTANRKCKLHLRIKMNGGAWVAQLVKPLTSAQVMISWFVCLSPASGSVLTARNLEPALESVSPSLCPLPACTLSLSLKNKCSKKLKVDLN